MSDRMLWKYCTPAMSRSFLISLRLLGGTALSEDAQIACLYAVAKHAESHYRPIEIPKRDGTVRRLWEPDPLLKTIQRNLLRHVLEGLRVSPHATAYRAGRSILDNAQPHCGQPVLLKLDIASFFDSVRYPMVWARAFPGHLFPPEVRSLLTRLCCRRDRLPQGAPTSAAVSNLVMKPFDDHMGVWCAERGIAYTRYSDDMSFSGEFAPRDVIRKVRHFLEAMGFALNEGKTRVQTKHTRQVVTGVVVNERLQADRETRRSLRQEIHHCFAHGVAGHLAWTGDGRAPEVYLRSLLGRVSFVLQVNPDDAYFRDAAARLRALLDAQTPAR